jgi:alkylated DNA repair protein (DNA oxidative demethylase)
LDLFSPQQPDKLMILPDAYLLKGFALSEQTQLMADLHYVISLSPLRRMVTPGGFTMSVAMSNCGALGWVTARTGYRYTTYDPLNDAPWPAMPQSFLALAINAAAHAGYQDFSPDACLINRYNIGARMTLHQDKNELDFSQPIVSVSLGLTAVFQLGGFQRADKAIKLQLDHGDVVVWGGISRMRYHGILPLKAGPNPLEITPTLADCRINLTFRKAGLTKE